MLALSRRLFNDFPSFDRHFDRFFNDAWNRDICVSPGLRVFHPEIEAFERDGQHVYRLALPGVDPADVDLSVVDGKLTVQVGAEGTGRRQAGRLAREGLLLRQV